MAVRRPRRARKARAPRLPSGTYRALAAPGDDLEAAANVIADEARRLAGTWSRQIPPAIEVEASDKVAIVSVAVGPAYPNEVEGVRHPTFGHKPHVKNEYRPFLKPAADAKAGAAMDRYAEKLDRMLKKAGFG